MNNDIPRLNLGAKKANNVSAQQNRTQIAMPEMDIDKNTMRDSMEFLSSIGCAQVNMDNLNTSRTTRQAMEKFLQNPEYVQAHVEFCDGLVAKGYCLEEAIEKSDLFFGALKDESIYG